MRQPVVKPEGDTKPNLEIVQGLAKRLDLSECFDYTLDIVALSLELFIVLPYIIHGQLSVQAVRDSLQLILGGPFTVVFWLFFFALGLLFPLVIEIREIVPILSSGASESHRKIFAASAAVLVLGGGFLLRYIFIYAGQISAFR
jgi:protein NrfD